MRSSPLPFVAITLALVACSDSDTARRSDDLPCEGNAVGSFALSDQAEVLYTVEFSGDTTGSDSTRTDSLRIGALFIGRGAPGWKGRADSSRVRPPADSLARMNGGALGALWVARDPRTNTAFVHTRSERLDSANVVLIGNVEQPDTAGALRKLRIRPGFALAPGACANRASATGMQWRDSLRAQLLRVPEIREFAAGR